MRKFLIPITMLVLAGCASQPRSASESDPTIEFTTLAPPSYSDPNEQAFVDAVTDDELIPRYGDPDTALQFGHAICEAYGKAISTGVLAQEISKQGVMSYTVVEEFAYEAADNLCPVFRGH